MVTSAVGKVMEASEVLLLMVVRAAGRVTSANAVKGSDANVGHGVGDG